MKQRFCNYSLFILPAFLFTLLFLVSSCEKQDITFGSGFIDNTITNLVLVDTATVNVETAFVDSFVTSGSKAILAGKYKDEKFGTISAQSFLELGKPTATIDIPVGSVFDSLELILKLDKTFYGDTLAPYNVSVHQLDKQLGFTTTQSAFYNNNTWPYSSTSLGTSQLVISPSTRDTLAIKLSSAVGTDLFSKLQANTIEVQTTDQFVNYFRGLAIVGGNSNNCIIGFKDSVIMRIHYRKPGVFASNATIDFGVNETNFQFNNITADRSGTAIAAMNSTNRLLPSSATGNAGYSQYISGVVAKLSFPYIKDLYQLPNFLKIVKAELDVKPVLNSFQGYYTLPPQLEMSGTDKNNLLGSPLTIINGTTSVVQYGGLYIDNLYGTSTSYAYDVTSYLQAQMANTEVNKNGLLAVPPTVSTTFNRLLIADAANGANRTQLKIYYAAVK